MSSRPPSGMIRMVLYSGFYDIQQRIQNKISTQTNLWHDLRKEVIAEFRQNNFFFRDKYVSGWHSLKKRDIKQISHFQHNA